MTGNNSNKVTAADILAVVPITRKTLWLWQKKYNFFPDPEKVAHPKGKGIVGYYPKWVLGRCKKVYDLQKEGYKIAMITEILNKEAEDKSVKKVLIVDDEKKFSLLLKKFFVRNGYIADVAYDGLDAGLKAVNFKPSIILLDINLPGLNGLDVCENLKSNPATKNISIIIISASLEYTEKAVLAAGGDMFLTKPIDLASLLTKCNEIVGGPQKITNS
jgi:CheY-like chemotaxis protein